MKPTNLYNSMQTMLGKDSRTVKKKGKNTFHHENKVSKNLIHPYDTNNIFLERVSKFTKVCPT